MYKKGEIILTLTGIKKLSRTISRNWRLMVVVMILTTISGYLLSAYVIDRHYITTTEIYIESLDSQTASEKAATCQLLFTSPQMYDIINDYLEIGFTYAEFDEMISVKQVNKTTPVLKIYVDCDNSAASYKLMTMYLEHLPKVIENYKENATFRIVRQPVEPANPAFPNDGLFTLGGFLIGFIIALIGIILIWKLDNTVTTDDDITEMFGISLLGEIPDFDNEVDYLGR